MSRRRPWIPLALVLLLWTACRPGPVPLGETGNAFVGLGATEPAPVQPCGGIDLYPTRAIHLGAAGGAVVFQFEGCATSVEASCTSWITVDVDARLEEASPLTIRQVEAVEVPAEGLCTFTSDQNDVELPVYLP